MGILGAVVAKFVFSFFGADSVTGFNYQSIIFSSLGVCIVIWFFRKIRRLIRIILRIEMNILCK